MVVGVEGQTMRRRVINTSENGFSNAGERQQQDMSQLFTYQTTRG